VYDIIKQWEKTMDEKIYYSINDGKTWEESHYGVRISMNIEHSEEGPVQLVLNNTHEGLIIDVNKFNEDGTESECLGTSSEMFDEITERLLRQYDPPKARLVADKCVINIWECENKDDAETCGNSETCEITPDWYQNNGTPVCCNCDTDLIYVRTEVVI
jgi:hypothetical protein